MRPKLGLSPVVAILILLVLTITAAGAAFFWLSNVQQRMNEYEQFNVISLEDQLKAGAVLASAEYDSGRDRLELNLQNLGKEALPLSASSTPPTTVWLLRDANNRIICSTDFSGNTQGVVCEGCTGSIAPNEARKIVLSNFKESALCSISLQKAKSVLYLDIDFSGKAIASGKFEKN